MDEPTPEELKFLREMGMTEIEPGRWVSAPEASSPDMQAFLDSMSPAEEEQLDLLMRAGRVQNEVDMEQTGSATAVSVQPVPEGLAPAADGIELSAYAAIRDSDVEALEALEPQVINDKLDETMLRYPQLLPPDGLAAALRQLKVKCRAVDVNPYTDGQTLPPEAPGFRVALFAFPAGTHRWVHG